MIELATSTTLLLFAGIFCLFALCVALPLVCAGIGALADLMSDGLSPREKCERTSILGARDEWTGTGAPFTPEDLRRTVATILKNTRPPAPHFPREPHV